MIHRVKKRCSNTLYIYVQCGCDCEMQFEWFYCLNHSVVASVVHFYRTLKYIWRHAVCVCWLELRVLERPVFHILEAIKSRGKYPPPGIKTIQKATPVSLVANHHVVAKPLPTKMPSTETRPMKLGRHHSCLVPTWIRHVQANFLYHNRNGRRQWIPSLVGFSCIVNIQVHHLLPPPLPWHWTVSPPPPWHSSRIGLVAT